MTYQDSERAFQCIALLCISQISDTGAFFASLMAIGGAALFGCLSDKERRKATGGSL